MLVRQFWLKCTTQDAFHFVNYSEHFGSGVNGERGFVSPFWKTLGKYGSSRDDLFNSSVYFFLWESSSKANGINFYHLPPNQNFRNS